MVFLIYSNTITHDYAWDDSIVITENAKVQKGLTGIPDLFLKYNSNYKSDKYGYRPIVLSSFALEYELFGLNPNVGHFMNVAYFAILGCVIFHLLRKIFLSHNDFIPLTITFLFIAHPIHVEVVANIKSRDEIFSLLFSLLSLNEILKYVYKRQNKHVLFAFLLFVLGFLSKESAVIFLPIVILTLRLVCNWTGIEQLLKPGLIIFGVLLFCLIIVKFYMQSQLGIDSSRDAGIFYENGVLGNSFFYTDLWTEKITNAFLLLMLYLKNFFIPTNLVYYYGFNQISIVKWTNPIILISVILHLSLLIYSIWSINKQKLLCYFILFYFISISIYLHLFQTLADTMADRFMFTPSLALLTVSILLIEKLFKQDFLKLGLFDVLWHNTGRLHIGLKYLFILVFFILSGFTIQRNKVWANNETLISNDMISLENCSRANFYYADILKKKLQINFDSSTELDMLNHYKKSITISNQAYYSYLGLATYYIHIKKNKEAVYWLTTMLKLYPNTADPHYYIGQAYYEIGDFNAAVPHLKKSLKLAPDVSITYYYLSLCLAKQGNFNDAINIINIAKNKFGESSIILDALGMIYFEQNLLDNSTYYTLKMLNYGEDARLVYGKIIGRYQLKKQDSQASYYYKIAQSKGVFN